MTTLYTKRGRRYYPVAEYDPEAIDMLPNGSHLVTVSPGNRIITYQVDPDHAGLLAALQAHEKTLMTAVITLVQRLRAITTTCTCRKHDCPEKDDCLDPQRKRKANHAD